MSEGPKWSIGAYVVAKWDWLPWFVLDTESNFIFCKVSWLCFELHGDWRK